MISAKWGKKTMGLRVLWKRLLWFDLLLLAFLILGTRLATVLHEVLGHGLTAVLAGGDIASVQISLLGGGRVVHHLPETAGIFARFVVACSGIAVNLFTGALVFVQFRRSPPQRLQDGFWILFAGASLLGGVAYAALGLYYGQGDPVAWMSSPSPGAAWFALPFLLAAPFFGFVAVKTYASWADRWFPAKNATGRAIVVLLTAGVAVSAYAALYVGTGAGSRALDAPQAAADQARKAAFDRQLETLVRAVQKMRPDLSESQVRALIRVVPVTTEPIDIPQKPPIKPALGVLYGVGGLIAIRRTFVGPPGPAVLSLRWPLTTAALAAAVLAALGLAGGWVYRAPAW